MGRLGDSWAKVPSWLRTALWIVFVWLPLWLFVLALIDVLVDDLGLSAGSGSLVQLLIYAALVALLWYLFIRPAVDRAHGGSAKHRAYVSAIRTGEIGPEADRERLRETVQSHFAGRKFLWFLAAIALGALVGLPLALALLNPPIDSEDLFIVGSQLVLFLIFFIPVLLFHRRQSRRMAALKEALDADELPPDGGLPG